MLKGILILLLSLSLGAFFTFYHNPTVLDTFRPSFLTLSLAVATFYVSFAIGSLNSSAYRSFHRSTPSRFLGACVLFLLFAFLPLVFLVTLPDYYIQVSLFVLPLLVGAGACLLEVARHETDVLTLLDRLCSVRKTTKYLKSLIPEIGNKITETKALEMTKPNDCPIHEIDWHLPVPPQENQPLIFLTNLALLVIQRGDVYAFSRIVARSLEILDAVETLELGKGCKDAYFIREELNRHVFDVLQRIVLALQREKDNMSLVRTAIDRLTELVIAKAKAQNQTQNIAFTAIRLMHTLGRHAYECGSQSEIRNIIIVSRQIIQKGLDNPPAVLQGQKTPDRISHFSYYLPQLAVSLKNIGTYAINKRDSALLYLCFESFGFLGCSSVKNEQFETTKMCLRALSQLGREAKAADLECHWDKCAVKPEDHAGERIMWIATWLVPMASEKRDLWVNLINTAYSRLYGKKTTVKIVTNKKGIEPMDIKVSEEDYVEEYFLQAGHRSVNYSDFTFLKDLELYCGTGIIWQGPTVSLSSIESEKVKTETNFQNFITTN